MNQLIEEHGYMGVAKAELTQKLTDWEPFTHKPTSWFDPEWMFGIKEGFDIVIANPPYISHVNYKYEDKSKLRALFSTYSGRADVYVVFYEKGISLLKDYGVLTYISPNKFFRAGYGAKLRILMYENVQLVSILDFGDTPIFEATTYPAVLTIENSKLGNYDFTYTKVHKLDDINELNQQQKFSRDYLKNQLWSFEKSDLEEVWRKIKKDSIELKSYIKDEFYRGIVTGLNEAFVIDEEQKENLLKLNPEASEIIKPYLKGREVKRWRTEAKSYIIFTYHGIDISKYPAIEKYLSQFKNKLNNRATSNNHKWYELQQPQTGIFKQYEKIKIISTDIAKRCEFSIDKTGSYIDNTIFCIPRNDMYLLALLNSKLLETYYRSISSTIRGDFLRFKKIYLDLLPIRIANKEQERFFSEKVEGILALTSNSNYSFDPLMQAKVIAFEKDIDQMVYKLYDLTEDEIRVVEGKTPGGGEPEPILVNTSATTYN